MTTYKKLVVDASTGEHQTIEITEAQLWRDKLGLPDAATDAEIDAARAAWEASLMSEEERITELEAVRSAVADTLDAYPVLEIDALVQQVEDTNARAALDAINTLVNALRAIVALS